MRIGDIELLDDLPRQLEVGSKPYILSRNSKGNPVLFDAVCPHKGGTVEVVSESCLRCPQHNWEFDSEEGTCTNIPGEELSTYKITKRNDGLYTQIQSGGEESVRFGTRESDQKPSISLISHATLLIEYGEFSLLTDPWIDGPAFLGGWTQYPPSPHNTEELADRVDAIWITHEHSDHLHPPTLQQFDSNIPVYVPELNYQRLAERLFDEGMTNVHRLPTGTPFEISENVEAVCFESSSTWNDSILAVDCGGFQVLNVNDAGVNWNVHNQLGTVDLVASGFAFGASGYPLTWDHLSDDEKKSLIDDRNKGALDTCEQLVDMFEPDYFLPFAKFFALPQPAHEEYRQKLVKNTPSDVADRLSDRETRVLDLLPGEAWSGADDSISRRKKRERFWNPDVKNAFLSEAHEKYNPFVSKTFDLSHEELRNYFVSMSQSALAGQIESHALTLILTGDDRTLNSLVTFEHGEIQYQSTDSPVGFGSVDARTHVKMRCPGHLVQHVVRNDLSWDELHVGYWAEWSREPDEYNLPFWRLLHAPWEAREDTMNIAEEYDIDTKLEGYTMADLVEQQEVQPVLRQYGMYCAGCPNGLGEEILEAARIHGLDPDRTEELVSRIENLVFSDDNELYSD